MNIGVAIVTYNSARDIRACIESVVLGGIQDIAIMDSASGDTTVQELSSLGYPYEVLEENRGFGYAANRAAFQLNTEYVLLLNPDSLLPDGSLDRLRKTLSQNPAAGIVGMLLSDSSGKPERMGYGDEPTLFTMLARHFFYKKPEGVPFAVDWVSGGALVIKRQLFEDLGGFDESFFLYWEDVDLCRRARQKGYTVLMDPAAKVTHVRGGSNLGEATKTRIYGESADRYFKKHYSSTIWHIQRFLRRLYRL